MLDTGIQLEIQIGATRPLPAPFEVADALSSVEVTNRDSGRDGFQMTFNVGRDSPNDYGLLANKYLDPPTRVILIVRLGVLPQVLIDGIITNHQLAPSNAPGGSRLVVTGDDIGRQLNLKDQNKTFKNQSDSEIVRTILNGYSEYLLTRDITTTDTRRQENDGITTQQDTDLAFIQKLATRNGFVFYIEPTAVPGQNKAYWGAPNSQRPVQPSLKMNMGPDTNLASLSFGYDALGPATPEISVLDPVTKRPMPVSVPGQLAAPRASRTAVALREIIPRNTANKDQAQAGVQARSLTVSASDAITASGELHVVRYGQVLRARQDVEVCGVGESYGGRFHVTEVTHYLSRGEYRQRFSLSRDGLGALSPVATS
jgi:phage protein D